MILRIVMVMEIMGNIKVKESNLARLINVDHDVKTITITQGSYPYNRWLSFNGFQNRKAKIEEVAGTFFDVEDNALDFHYIATNGFGNRIYDRDRRFDLDYKKLNEAAMTFDFELLTNMTENEMGIGNFNFSCSKNI